MRRRYREAMMIALCWLGAAAAIPAMAQTTAVAGTTPGHFSVNESGAATYRIPIQVPPGVAGMEPKLELAYNSQGGNGLLGMGWNLSGLSTINRCPRTMALDSFRGAVKFDMNDRYCMDGQRLILVSGTYGVAGSEYRTELDSFSKIVASGTAGNGVASFKVQTKAGLTMEYGNTADSRIEAQGKTTVRVWALNKVSDVKTNYLTVSYYKSADSSVYAPLTVGYDGNVVNIEYETTRADRIQGYMAGSLVQVDRRISHIKTYAKGSSDLVFDYKIGYTGGATVQRSVIANISRCERNGNCLSGLALTIGNTATVGFTSSSAHLANLSDSAFVHGVGDAGLRVVDLNGDGLPDLLHLGYFVNGEFGGGLIRRAFINTGTGFVRNDAYVNGVSDSAFTHTYSRDAGLRVVDLNGDGLPDLLHLGYFVNGEWGGAALKRAFINTGSGFVQDNTWTANLSDSAFVHGGGDGGLRVVDLNGDGLPDLLHLGYFVNGEFGGGLIRRAFINTGTGFVRNDAYVSGVSDSAFTHTYSRDAGLRVVDLNGDGLPDLLHLGYFVNGEWGGAALRRAFINTGSGFVQDNTWIANMSDSAFVHGGWDAGLQVVDLNGDGLPDLLHLGYFVNGEFGGGLIRRAFINTGTIFVRNDAYVSGASDSAFTHTNSRDAGLRVVDLNGDGLPDLLHLGYFVNGEWGGGALKRAFINTGSGFVQDNTWTASLSDSAFAHSGRGSGLEIVDLNGDGVSDLLMLGYFLSGEFGGGAVMRSYLNNGMADYRLKGVQQAGAGTDINYQPLTKKSIYTKDAAPNAAVYPKLDLQYSMYVVGEVKTSNGVGGMNAVQYSYGGLKAELGTGRGMLGFRWTKSKNLANNIESYTEFNQNWPLTGSVAKSETRLAGSGNASVLKRTTNSYAQSTGSATSTTFVYPSQSVEESWDLGGAAYPTVTNTYQYGQSPQYGDPTQISVVNSAGAGKTTVNEYWPANTGSGSWVLGRLKKATVTSVAP
jgi:hypothetical protein